MEIKKQIHFPISLLLSTFYASQIQSIRNAGLENMRDGVFVGMYVGGSRPRSGSAREMAIYPERYLLSSQVTRVKCLSCVNVQGTSKDPITGYVPTGNYELVLRYGPVNAWTSRISRIDGVVEVWDSESDIVTNYGIQLNFFHTVTEENKYVAHLVTAHVGDAEIMFPGFEHRPGDQVGFYKRVEDMLSTQYAYLIREARSRGLSKITSGTLNFKEVYENKRSYSSAFYPEGELFCLKLERTAATAYHDIRTPDKGEVMMSGFSLFRSEDGTPLRLRATVTRTIGADNAVLKVTRQVIPESSK